MTRMMMRVLYRVHEYESIVNMLVPDLTIVGVV